MVSHNNVEHTVHLGFATLMTQDMHSAENISLNGFVPKHNFALAC